jgi:hypothetical protein
VRVREGRGSQNLIGVNHNHTDIFTHRQENQINELPKPLLALCFTSHSLQKRRRRLIQQVEGFHFKFIVVQAKLPSPLPPCAKILLDLPSRDLRVFRATCSNISLHKLRVTTQTGYDPPEMVAAVAIRLDGYSPTNCL